jgi:formyl-CoA transferase/CoA:oxalate CoA-transferase
MARPLDDITILDLTHALAGPFCSTMLADYGANVIKLEPPGAGDLARVWGAPVPGPDFSYFVTIHRNKRSIVVDLKKPEGKALFFKLVEKADVVIENFRVGALKRLGLGYEEAKKHNRGIIYCSVSGFGQDGPYRDRAALDLILQAESGMISVTGEAGGRGVRCGVSIADLAAGMNAAYGVMLAIRMREKTGEGQHVDVSMMEGQLALLCTTIGNYYANGELPKPQGTAYPVVVPYQTFQTKTRDLAIAIAGQKLWKIMCPIIGAPELTDDPLFATGPLRMKNRVPLIEKLQAIFLTKSYEEWEKLLLDNNVPVGAINDIAQVVEHPQVKARGAIIETKHPKAGKVKQVRSPLRLPAMQDMPNTPAPLHGEHSSAILRDVLKMSDAEIAALKQSGAVGGD